MKRFIALFVFTLFLLPIVFAGVTNPLPSDIQLLKGESGRFKFQIQNLNKPEALECKFELQGESDLEVAFDENIALIEPNSIAEFYGTVDAPKTLGKHSQNFCVRCTPQDKQSGASVQIDSCGLPINVDVVLEKNRENMTIPDEPTNISLIVVIVIVALVIFILWLYFGHRVQKKPVASKKKATKKKPVTSKKKATKKKPVASKKKATKKKPVKKKKRK